jgi:DNA primase
VALIPDEIITELRDRADIVAIIGEHVALKKAGVNHKGLCPFHQEKTPSFNVNAQKKTFYCFGCQKGGDVFAFVMELQGKSFVEVARELAGRMNIVIPEREPTPEERARRSETSRLHDVNSSAAAFYRAELLDAHRGAVGRAYLQSRGIGEEVSQQFKLGLAPEGWDGLSRHLEAARIPAQLPITLGLLAPRQKGNGVYDRFRHRLMCPVILPAGEIAGFSGRALGNDPDAPKYFNSPESPIYKKSHLLFGLHAARAGFRAKGRALLVEGNFDVIALHQAGFTETVAPLGTALTEHQVERLRQLAPRVVLCLDGDKAGRAAALRAVPLILEAGLDARVVTLPDGQDPDSFVRSQGAAVLEELIAKAPEALDFFLDELWFRSDKSTDARAKALREGAPLIALVRDEIKRGFLVDHFARALDVSVQVVETAVRRPAAGPHQNQNQNSRQDYSQAQKPAQAPQKVAPPVRLPEKELKVLAILADHPGLRAAAEQLGVRSLLTDERLRDMYSAAPDGRLNLNDVPEDIRDAVATALFAGEYIKVPNPSRTLNETVGVLRAEQLDAEVVRLTQQLKDAERRGDQALARELSKRQIQTRNEAAQLKRRPEEEPR